MKQTIKFKDSYLNRIITEQVKRILNEGQYEKGFDSGQKLIKTRIERYGDDEGNQKIVELYHTMLNNLTVSKDYGLTTNTFLKGQFDAIEKYLDSIGM